MRKLLQMTCVCGLAAALALPAPLPAGLDCPGNGTPYPIDCPWPVCPDSGKAWLSQVGLSLDTPGCPTTFNGDPDCGSRTHWTLDKVLTDPADGMTDRDFTFTVTVTGETGRLLRSSGRIVLSNGGEQVPYIESIIVNLEKSIAGKGGKKKGKGSTGKPSGANWETLMTATAVRFQACADFFGLAGTCFGPYSNDPGATLRLFDPATGDPVVFPTDIQVGPTCGEVDNDRDGLRGEDPPGDANGDGNDDDDFDGRIDEDGSDVCLCATALDFEVDFDLAGQPAFEGMGCGGGGPNDDYRLEILVTFRGAGERGKSKDRTSCSADLDCDGLLTEDGKVCTTPDDLLNESEKNNVRTIKHRREFSWPTCNTVQCPQVYLSDEGASSMPPGCATVDSDTLGEPISVDDPECPSAGEPIQHVRTVAGTAVCNDGGGDCMVSNTATLTGDGCEGLIEDSSATARFALECITTHQPFPPPGSYCTQTQEDWGMECPDGQAPDPDSDAPGCARDACFPLDFPDGLTIGDTDCANFDLCYQAEWLTSATMEAYLPETGLPGALDDDLCTLGLGPDPTTTTSGVLGGELAAATMNKAFDLSWCRIGPACEDSTSPLYTYWCRIALVELVFTNDNAGECLLLPTGVIGANVGEVLFSCNAVAGGDCFSLPVNFLSLTEAECTAVLAHLNAAFRNCAETSRCLAEIDDPILPPALP